MGGGHESVCIGLSAYVYGLVQGNGGGCVGHRDFVENGGCGGWE